MAIFNSFLYVYQRVCTTVKLHGYRVHDHPSHIGNPHSMATEKTPSENMGSSLADLHGSMAFQNGDQSYPEGSYAAVEFLVLSVFLRKLRFTITDFGRFF